MEPLEALEELERKFNRKAPTLRKWLENGEKVDPSLAIAVLRQEIGVKVIPYGSVVLGVSDPGDIDGYVHPGDEGVLEQVKAVLQALTGLTPSLRPLRKGSVVPNTVAGKIERLFLKGGEIRFYGPFYLSKLIRDAEHLRRIARKASENELFVHLYALELIDHLKRKGLTDKEIAERLQRYGGSPSRIMSIVKRNYPDVFTFLDRVVNTVRELLKKGEAL